MANLTLNLEQLNTQVFTVAGLKDSVTSAYVNNATAVTADLFDKSNVQVAAFGGPIALSFVVASNGNYQGAIAATFTLPKGGGYTMKIDGTDTNGNKFHIERPAQIITRQA
jgi:hypothetical protein